MKQLSVVVPMYNVEPYVERCLRSLEQQDILHNEYEIICINDGSPDNCREVVLRLQKEFKNIVLIDQENQGVSRARNNGINRSNGKYLLFIDPDDYVDPDSLARIISNADKHNAQVSFLGFTLLNEDESPRQLVSNHLYAGKVYNGLDAYHLSHGDGKTDPDRMWAVLFDTAFIKQNQLFYHQNIPYLEDGELIARILCVAEYCIFDGQSFYQRTSRPGSATHSSLFTSDRATSGFLSAADNLKRFQTERKLNKKQIVFLNQPICKFILLSLLSKLNDRGEFKKISNKLKSVNLQRCKLSGCNNYYLIEGTLFNISPWLFFLHRRIGAPLLRLVKP